MAYAYWVCFWGTELGNASLLHFSMYFFVCLYPYCSTPSSSYLVLSNWNNGELMVFVLSQRLRLSFLSSRGRFFFQEFHSSKVLFSL